MSSRRNLLKIGLDAGGSAVLGPRPCPAQLCPPDPAHHQRHTEFMPQKFYEVRASAFLHQYHPELPPALSFGYDGMTPGPTFHARYGEPLFMRMHNDFPPDFVGFPLPSIATHVHNFHTASESDGFPMNFIDPGEFWDHHYAMFPAGFDDREKLTTLWYHDHRFDFTAANVYAGLAAFFLIFDENDSGDENDTNPDAWRLPSGDYDVPLILHDVLFDTEGQAVFDVFNTDGILGDEWTVIVLFIRATRSSRGSVASAFSTVVRHGFTSFSSAPGSRLR